jgi:hypothetical protein
MTGTKEMGRAARGIMNFHEEVRALSVVAAPERSQKALASRPRKRATKNPKYWSRFCPGIASFDTEMSQMMSSLR